MVNEALTRAGGSPGSHPRGGRRDLRETLHRLPVLRDGWAVRTTVRGIGREAAARAQVAGLVEPEVRLEVVEADLESDDGWGAAVAGCSHVLHVASPLPSSNPVDDDVLVRPARDGALRVLRAARDAGVRRAVMTASTAAVSYGHGSYDVPATEDDWSDERDLCDTSGYERSKTIAERAAWAWHAREGGGLELATICPGAVLGPVLGPDFSASIDIVRKLMDGSLPGLPRFGWPLVDVRDVADIHVLAMTSDVAAGQRYLAAGRFVWMREIAQVLRRTVPELARRVPRHSLPDWLARLSGRFDPVVRDRLFELGKHRPVSAAKAEAQLGWRPRDPAGTIADTARSLVALGVVAES